MLAIQIYWKSNAIKNKLEKKDKNQNCTHLNDVSASVTKTIGFATVFVKIHLPILLQIQESYGITITTERIFR